MTRVIGGSVGGRRLRTPPGDGTRPTTDRVREALFSSLEVELGGFEDLRVLDLYAGSGALGLEALSRGAAHLTAVEAQRRTAQVVVGNARDLGFSGVEVLAQPVERVLAQPPGAAYDLVLADPPYDVTGDALARVLDLLVTGGWLDPDGLLVLERSSRTPEPTWPGGWEVVRHRTYGETALWYLRAASRDEAQPPSREDDR